MITEYSSKAEIYHKYRWDYHDEAIRYIIKKGNITSDSVVLDIGAGTGILTKHFTEIADQLYAVEPDSNMIEILKKNLDKAKSLQRYSDYIPEIPENSVDIILAAHSLHWFDFTKTLVEFNRISKANCHLFAIENRNYSTGPLFQKTGELFGKYRNSSIQEKHDLLNIDNYFKNKKISEAHFDYLNFIDLDTYLGSIVSTSYMPSPGDASYNELQADAEALFSEFSVEGKIDMQVRTTVKHGLLAETDLT